ncbi:alginate O-acetyltransferase AlgX-related protein [Loktanella sp. S4079]|uniref:alginate O-acetyltransferase AlgX-related protein n=1 Tax=Loktanella sp. S4079 TaxID=579483 RepID=UPI0005F9C326|nr:hypothetical protein [Loktanella sp. S4079]KJZ19330.1 hypothetical protein TW80_11175 [Loktanella sp. S4079]
MFINTALKLAAPVAFFGYAAFANLALFQGDVEGPKLEGIVQGEFTQEVDTLYRANLPHRDVAVGWVGAARYVLLNEGRDGVVPGEKGWLFSAEEFRNQDREAIGFDATLAWMTEVQNTLSAMGTELVIVPLPAKLEIAQAHSGDADQAQRMIETYDMFTAALTANGFAMVDTRDALASAPDAFFKTDTHWTTQGAQAVAQAVADSGVIAPGEEAFTVTPVDPVTFTGDLVSFVTSETLAPTVGLTQETVEPYIADLNDTGADLGGIDLFGNDGPMPITLVGTSYSANPNWSFVEALKISLSHDVLNYAKEGQGPVAPMHEYLEALDPAEAPPVVIWEFPVRYLSDPSLLDSLSATVGGDNV